MQILRNRNQYYIIRKTVHSHHCNGRPAPNYIYMCVYTHYIACQSHSTVQVTRMCPTKIPPSKLQEFHSFLLGTANH